MKVKTCFRKCTDFRIMCTVLDKGFYSFCCIILNIVFSF